MIKFVGKLFGSLLRTIILGVLLVAGLIGGGYYWYANSQLHKTLQAAEIAKGYTLTCDLIRGRSARIETSWPLTWRVHVKSTETHNWVPTEEYGLVRAIFQWSPDQNKWVEEPHESLPLEQRARLEGMIRMPTNGGLIEALESEDAATREVAFRELKIRTGEDFGYRPEASPADRAEAVARWEKWWEENKVRWTTDKVLDKVQEILK